VAPGEYRAAGGDREPAALTSAVLPPSRFLGRLARIASDHGDALAVYALGLGVTFASGERLTIPFRYYQLLDRGWLEDRLLESVLHLHGQPPLLNLLLGLALKLARLLGVSAESLLLPVQLAAGLLTVVALSALARALLGPLARRVVLALVLLDPMLYLVAFQWFYTLHELLLLALSGVLARRFLSDGSTRWLSGTAICLVLLTNERSLFHPLFSLAALLLLVGLRSGLDPSVARRLVVVAVSLPFLFAWSLKNYVQVGVFGPSSWTGFNVSDRLGIQHWPLVAFLDVDVPERAILEERARRLVPPRMAAIPAVAETRKSDGSPNWNHIAMVSISEELLARSAEVLKREPGRLVWKAVEGYVRCYAISTGRQSESGQPDVRIRTTFFVAWMEAYERLLLLRRGPDPPPLPVTGFALLFPVAVALAAARAWRERRSDPLRVRTAIYLAWPVVWVLVLILFVEGNEGNRLRLSTQPFVLLLAGWGAGLLRPTSARPSLRRSG
jgi:hypothetical protein